MKGFTVMYDHKWKIGGMIISAVGLLIMVAERIRPFILLRKLTATQHYHLFEWITLFGLVLMIYSKEKYDDERTKAIRLKSFQIAFVIQQSLLLSMAFTASFAKGGMQLDGTDLYMFGAAGIILYLLIFHVGLYFDFLWEYDDKGLWENLRNISKNKWGILVYLLLSALMLLLLTLFAS